LKPVDLGLFMGKTCQPEVLDGLLSALCTDRYSTAGPRLPAR
jgi:hypothetical protein